MVKIQVSEDEYLAANSNGCVFGKRLDIRPIKFVYIDLGSEREYEPRPWEYSEIKQRIFFRCTVYYGSSQEAVDLEEYDYFVEDETVIIQC